MPYMLFEEQVASHLAFLQSMGLHVQKLSIDSGFVRCPGIEQIAKRKELCYVTSASRLKNGLLGLSTTCRCPGGEYVKHATYGCPPPFSGDSYPANICSLIPFKANDSPDESYYQKIECFWNLSSISGLSDYLIRKGVGSYGIRFRVNTYGRVAVIPMRNISGKLCCYQLINGDCTKRFPKKAVISNLFHNLSPLIDGVPIGIAESYVTAATCFELTGLPTVTSFCLNNLAAVVEKLRGRYSQSPIIIFADNDRHLRVNKGVEIATTVAKKITNCTLAVPYFNHSTPVNSSHTDWNDLVRVKGAEDTKRQLMETLRVG